MDYPEFIDQDAPTPTRFACTGSCAGGRRNSFINTLSPEQQEIWWKGYFAGRDVGSKRNESNTLLAKIKKLEFQIKLYELRNDTFNTTTNAGTTQSNAK